MYLQYRITKHIRTENFIAYKLWQRVVYVVLWETDRALQYNQTKESDDVTSPKHGWPGHAFARVTQGLSSAMGWTRFYSLSLLPVITRFFVYKNR